MLTARDAVDDRITPPLDHFLLGKN
jgi:hypothetical protein